VGERLSGQESPVQAKSNTRKCVGHFGLTGILKRELDGFGTCFFLLALSHDGGSEAAAEVFGKFVELGVTVNFDGLLGGITDDVAVVAPRQVIFEFSAGAGVQDAVEVVG